MQRCTTPETSLDPLRLFIEGQREVLTELYKHSAVVVISLAMSWTLTHLAPSAVAKLIGITTPKDSAVDRVNRPFLGPSGHNLLNPEVPARLRHDSAFPTASDDVVSRTTPTNRQRTLTPAPQMPRHLPMYATQLIEPPLAPEAPFVVEDLYTDDMDHLEQGYMQELAADIRERGENLQVFYSVAHDLTEYDMPARHCIWIYETLQTIPEDERVHLLGQCDLLFKYFPLNRVGRAIIKVMSTPAHERDDRVEKLVSTPRAVREQNVEAFWRAMEQVNVAHETLKPMSCLITGEEYERMARPVVYKPTPDAEWQLYEADSMLWWVNRLEEKNVSTWHSPAGAPMPPASLKRPFPTASAH